MTQPCEVILIILFLITFIFIRKKKYNYAISVIPLFIVPLVQIISNYLFPIILQYIPINSYSQLFYITLCIAVGICGILIGRFGITCYENKLIRKFYFFSTIGFSVTLALILLFNIK
ncbi:MAG: hypothetical protein RR483_01925 [Clostridia bacterium]